MEGSVRRQDGREHRAWSWGLSPGSAFYQICKLGRALSFTFGPIFSTLKRELWFPQSTSQHIRRCYEVVPGTLTSWISSMIPASGNWSVEFSCLWVHPDQSCIPKALAQGIQPSPQQFSGCFLQALYIHSTNISNLPTICQAELSAELIAGTTLTKKTWPHPSANYDFI